MRASHALGKVVSPVRVMAQTGLKIIGHICAGRASADTEETKRDAAMDAMAKLFMAGTLVKNRGSL